MTRILQAQWVALAVALAASPASAFYFPGWPGDGIPRDRNLVEPRNRFTDMQPGRITQRDVVPEAPTPSSSNTPEPGTWVLAVIGLGVVAALRKRK